MATINNNIATDPAHKTIDPRSFDDLLAVVASIKSQLGDKAHAEIGIICGSGLGPIGDKVENPTVLPYEKIPGFPSVHGECCLYCCATNQVLSFMSKKLWYHEKVSIVSFAVS
ncbi:unnamed protein product [Cylicostephanus goldi]|uniref:Uncharacterized protein n=1 Tax=Cylicostephanus goldi TaxID=71465 RepID=A0A3P7NEA3_CYLGO|nr:unnamed protein product [Cylicostephanus goldi]